MLLESAYLFIFVLLVALISIGIWKVSNQSNTIKNILFFLLGIIGWVIYLYLISHNGFIFDKSIPPKFPIFVFLPAFIFIGVFLYSIRNNKIFERIPNYWAIYYQSFRVIMEVIILMTFFEGLIPKQATFQGYNYEILFALTAPAVGYFNFKKIIISSRATILWNIIGMVFLLAVVSIMVSSFYTPQIWGSDRQLIDMRFTKLPLLFLPAFMVPSAIFVHFFSIIQLLKSEQSKRR